MTKTTRRASGFDIVEIPAEYKEKAEQYRASLIEGVADFDDEIMERFLEGETNFTADELRKGYARRRSPQVRCVTPGSAFKNKGVQVLMNAVVDYLPSPLDVPPIKAFAEDDEDTPSLEIVPDDFAPPTALAFKLWSDPFVGKLIFVRVYTGCLKKGMSIYNPRSRKTERISRLLIIKADKRDDIEEAYSGSICAIIGAKDIVTATLFATANTKFASSPRHSPIRLSR